MIGDWWLIDMMMIDDWEMTIDSDSDSTAKKSILEKNG